MRRKKENMMDKSLFLQGWVDDFKRDWKYIKKDGATETLETFERKTVGKIYDQLALLCSDTSLDAQKFFEDFCKICLSMELEDLRALNFFMESEPQLGFISFALVNGITLEEIKENNITSDVCEAAAAIISLDSIGKVLGSEIETIKPEEQAKHLILKLSAAGKLQCLKNIIALKQLQKIRFSPHNKETRQFRRRLNNSFKTDSERWMELADKVSSLEELDIVITLKTGLMDREASLKAQGKEADSLLKDFNEREDDILTVLSQLKKGKVEGLKNIWKNIPVYEDVATDPWSEDTDEIFQKRIRRIIQQPEIWFTAAKTASPGKHSRVCDVIADVADLAKNDSELKRELLKYMSDITQCLDKLNPVKENGRIYKVQCCISDLEKMKQNKITCINDIKRDPVMWFELAGRGCEPLSIHYVIKIIDIVAMKVTDKRMTRVIERCNTAGAHDKLEKFFSELEDQELDDDLKKACKTKMEASPVQCLDDLLETEIGTLEQLEEAASNRQQKDNTESAIAQSLETVKRNVGWIFGV